MGVIENFLDVPPEDRIPIDKPITVTLEPVDVSVIQAGFVTLAASIEISASKLSEKSKVEAYAAIQAMERVMGMFETALTGEPPKLQEPKRVDSWI